MKPVELFAEMGARLVGDQSPLGDYLESGDRRHQFEWQVIPQQFPTV